MTVAHILSGKGHAILTTTSDASVHSAAKTMAEKRIGALVAVGPGGEIAGIISERDIVRAVAENGAEALSLPVSAVMTARVRTCAPSDSEAELMVLMTDNRIRHLPVVENGKLSGMISIGDVVKFRIEAIEREADEMKSYIASAG